MKTFLALAAGAAILGTAAPVFAQKVATPYRGEVKVAVPSKVAPVKLYFVDGKPEMRVVGEWQDYLGGGAPEQATAIAFDNYEFDPNNIPFPTERPEYGPSCGLNAARYWFGPGYNNPYWYNDITSLHSANAIGKQSPRALIEFGYRGSEINIGNPANFWVAIFTTENFVTDPNLVNDNNARGGYDGIVVQFANLPPGIYVSDIDLTNNNLFWQMPNDNNGGYIVVYADNFQNNQFTLAAEAQPMLWGTKVNNPSQQGPLQWDDDNPTDGSWQAAELYDYTYNICPNPLGGMIAFLYEAAAPVIVKPSAFTIQRGILVSGGLSSLFDIDLEYLIVRKGLILNPAESPITVVVEGTSPVQNPSALTFTFRNRVNTPGLTQVIDLFDWNANNWDTVDAVTAPGTLTDQTFTVTGTNVGRYVRTGDRLMRARYRIRQTGPVTTSDWRSFTDQTVWTVTP